MGITRAKVHDPASHNDTGLPYIKLDVDDWTGVAITTSVFYGGEESHHERFTLYDYGQGIYREDTFDLGSLNTMGVLPMPGVEVRVNTDPTSYILDLRKAEHALFRYHPAYRMMVSIPAAREGMVLWVPTAKVPKCLEWVGGRTCNQATVKTVRKGLRDWPMCKTHVHIHNVKQALARKESRDGGAR